MKKDWSTIKKLIWLKIQMGASGILKVVSGITPLTIANAVKGKFKSITQHGKVVQNGNPTTANPVDIVCNNGALKWDAVNSRIYADGTPEILTVSATGVANQTATVENLLAVGPVADEQDIISGKVIRRTEVFKYDGTQTVKPTYMSTTGGKDDGAIIVQPRGAEYAGDVVSFEAQEGKPIDSLSVTLQPTQDLHGYDLPWPAGGGKNLFDKDAVTTGKYLDTATGLPVDAAGYVVSDYIPVQEGKSVYIPQTWTARRWFYDAQKAPTVYLNNSNPQAYVPPSDGYIRVSINVTQSSGVDLNTFQIEYGSSPTSYTPFENICPITGTDAVEVVQRGINLWDEEWEAGQYNGNLETGKVGKAWNSTRIRNKNSVPLKSDTTYYYVSTQAGFFYFFDADGKWLNQTNTNGTTVYANSTFTTPVGTAYAWFFVINTAEYGNNISINYPATDTAYHAYDPQSTTLDVEWGAVGKNQFDIAERVLNQTKANGTATDGYTLNNGVLSISKDVVNYGRVMLSAMPMKAGTYTLSFAWTASGSGRISYSIRNMGADPKVDIVGSTGTTTASVSQTFTLDTDANVAISIQPEGSATGTLSITNIMLNTGSSALPYEPYTKTIYGGHVDAVRGEIVLNKAEIVLDGSQSVGIANWRPSDGTSAWLYSKTLTPSIKNPATGTAPVNILCDKLVGKSYTPIYNGDVGVTAVQGSDIYGIAVRVPVGGLTTATLINEWLAENPLQIVYELATPITIPISPQTLTALRNNTVWSDAGSVDVLLTEELIESVTPQKLKTAEGTNTISVTSEIGNVDLGVTYKTPV